jgi:hypothetical protein
MVSSAHQRERGTCQIGVAFEALRRDNVRGQPKGNCQDSRSNAPTKKVCERTFSSMPKDIGDEGPFQLAESEVLTDSFVEDGLCLATAVQWSR